MDVRPVSREQCAPFILGIHYAARWPSISHAFGLFDDAELVGVVTYGAPPSSTLRAGIAGEGFKSSVLELNRLCLKHNRPNEASRLISQSLRRLPMAIIVSFADTAQGHQGAEGPRQFKKAARAALRYPVLPYPVYTGGKGGPPHVNT